MKKNILVISHERSGTHFLINTIAQSFGYHPEQIDLDNSQNIDWKNTAMVKQWMQQFHNNSTPGIFKSHHSYAFLAPLLPQLVDEFHVFYITRDGRDVMTSFWVYLNRLAPGWGPRTATVGEFMRCKASGGITQYQYHQNNITMLQRWVEHTRDWKNMASGIHYIEYETLHARFDTTVDRIADVLEQNAITVAQPSLSAPSSLPWKGSVGTWREYFTEADAHYFNLHAPTQTPQPDKC